MGRNVFFPLRHQKKKKTYNLQEINLKSFDVLGKFLRLSGYICGYLFQTEHKAVTFR